MKSSFYRYFMGPSRAPGAGSPARPAHIAAVVLGLLGCEPIEGAIALDAGADTDTEARVEQLEEQLAELRADLDRLLPEVAHAEIAIAECQAEVDALQVRVGELEAEELPERVEDLEGRVDTLWTAVDALYR